MSKGAKAAGVAWLITAVYYFYQYTLRSATVPMGWIIGCPLLGFVSDRLGRRKPVIVAAAVVLLLCLAWILYGPADVLPPYLLGPVFGGILRTVSGGSGPMSLEHYQTAFEPLLYGVGLAIVLTFVLRETGSAARPPAPVVAGGNP